MRSSSAKPVTMTASEAMAVFEFTAILGPVPDFNSATERLGETAVSSDGFFSESGGKATIEFERVADSLEEAVRSAISDINTAGLRVVRIETEETSLLERLLNELQPSRLK